MGQKGVLKMGKKMGVKQLKYGSEKLVEKWVKILGENGPKMV